MYSSQTANVQTALTSFVNLSPSFANSGSTFANWNTSQDGSGSSVANGSNFNFGTSEVLYATWVNDYHSVTFAENDNSNDVTFAMQTENAPTPLTLFASLNPALSNPGYSFVDWNSESNGGGVSYGDASLYSFSAQEILYAIWSLIPLATLNFDVNNGKGSVASISTETGGSTTLPSGSGLSYPGYSFIGWNTSADGSGTEYQAGSTYVFNGNESLYAQWSPNTYIVTYSYDGGVATLSSSNYLVGMTALTLPTPTFAGNTFSGWFNAETGGSLIGVGEAPYVPSPGPIQIFAQWNSNAIDVLTFDVNGGDGSISPYSGEDGSTTTLPSIGGVTKLGFAFIGWNTSADGSGAQYVEGQILKLGGNETLFAQWTAGPSDTLTFDANGGSGTIDPIIEDSPSDNYLARSKRTDSSRILFIALEHECDWFGSFISSGSRFQTHWFRCSLCAVERSQTFDVVWRGRNF